MAKQYYHMMHTIVNLLMCYLVLETNGQDTGKKTTSYDSKMRYFVVFCFLNIKLIGNEYGQI